MRIPDVRTVEGRQTITFRGQAAPLARLADLLDLDETPAQNKKAPASPGTHFPTVILRSGEQRLAVVVDALLDERNAVVKDLGLKPAAQAGKTAGGALLEDGKVALVLDPAELWGAFRRSEKSPGLQPMAEAPPKEPSRILVVDDSITTRSLKKSILEAHGYHVRVAVDGVDALERLRAERADLVIADILMPRLDGFGLLERIKKDRDLAQIPVIIVSSLERGEDQQRGLALGADAYIVKRKFDQRELLDAVRQLL